MAGGLTAARSHRLRHVRNLDRWIHADAYPALFYPELYLIDGGYKNCFESLRNVRRLLVLSF